MSRNKTQVREETIKTTIILYVFVFNMFDWIKTFHFQTSVFV